jgi:mono/diheme cytochrome c family protein
MESGDPTREENMKASILLVSVGVLSVAGCSTTPGSAQTASPEPVAEVAAAATILDGVFTAEQAARGQQIAQANCFGCHSQNEWSNPMFLSVWSGRPVAGFVQNIQATMPYDSPGRLTRQEYTDIFSYMLRLNNAPPGQAELPSDDAGLNTIQMVRP